MKSIRTLLLGIAALFAASTAAAAQDYPNQLVTIIVPFGAGSVTDLMAPIPALDLTRRGDGRDSGRSAHVFRAEPPGEGQFGSRQTHHAPDGHRKTAARNGRPAPPDRSRPAVCLRFLVRPADSSGRAASDHPEDQ